MSLTGDLYVTSGGVTVYSGLNVSGGGVTISEGGLTVVGKNHIIYYVCCILYYVVVLMLNLTYNILPYAYAHDCFFYKLVTRRYHCIQSRSQHRLRRAHYHTRYRVTHRSNHLKWPVGFWRGHDDQSRGTECVVGWHDY